MRDRASDRWRAAALVALLPPLATVNTAPAAEASAEQLDAVVVTARKKSETLQSVPMSITVIDRAAQRERGITHFTDLAAEVPGLQQSDLANSSRMTLRGVNSGDNNAFEQAVGTYVDGVYRGRMNQQHLGLFDVERIEVLKGPQVALYGNSSIGGAISVITRQPRFTPGGELHYRYGHDYRANRLEFGADLPLAESLALRVAASAQNEDRGVLPNDASGRSEPRQDHHAVRLSALWLASDALSLNLRHEQGRYERNGHIFEVFKHVDGRGNPWPNSHFVGIGNGRLNIGNAAPFSHPDAFLHTELAETQLQFDYDLDTLRLTALGAYSGYDFRHSSDVDITPQTLVATYQDERYRQWSQELRASGSYAALDFVAGLYWQRDDFRNDYFADFNMPQLLAPAFGVPARVIEPLLMPFSRHVLLDQRTRQSALFGHLDWHLGERLTASFGARFQAVDKQARQAVFTADIQQIDGPGRLIDVRWLNPALAPLLLGNADYLANPTGYVLTLADGTRVNPVLAPEFALAYQIVSLGRGAPHDFPGLDRGERHPLWQFALAWQHNEQLLLYLNASRGAKAGGFDFLYEGAIAAETEYADEAATVLEIGAKHDWADARLNLAAFYGKYDDLQVSVYDGGIGFTVGNAASSISRGVEAELEWRPQPAWRTRAALSYVDFRYDEFRDANCSTTERLLTGARLCDWSGERAPFVPRLEAVLALEHSWHSTNGWTLRQQLDWQYKGEHATASDNEIQTRQSAYHLFNYRLTFAPAAARWQLAFSARNLADEQYNVFTSVIPLAPGGAFANVRCRGRELALEFDYRF